MLESLFNKVQGLRPAILLKRDCNTGVSCEYSCSPVVIKCIFLFCIDNLSKNNYKRKNVAPIKRARASS